MRTTCFRKLLAMLCFAGAAGADTAVAQQVADADDLVLVRRTIDARYDLDRQVAIPPIDISRPALPLETALGSEVSRSVQVQSGDSVEGIVLREYGFGKSNSVDAYASIERKIVRLNKLRSPHQIRAGEPLHIPALPPLAATQPNPANPYNALPKISTYAPLSAATSGLLDVSSLSFLKPPTITSLNRRGAPTVAEYMWVPRAQVARERDLAGAASEAIQVHAETVMATFDSEIGARGSTSFLDPNEREKLKNVIAATPLQAPVLIILDDGWPSEVAFRNSIAWLNEAFGQIRRHFKYPVGQQTQALGPKARTTFPVPAFHARTIDRALQPLTKLQGDGVERVRVVYLPLTVAQEHAAAVLSDLVTLRLVDDWVGDRRGDDPPALGEVQRLRRIADDVIGRLPKDTGVRVVKTDKAVIEAVMLLADLYARATGDPYVVNLSWTTPKLQNRYADMRFNLGLVVAAAGNASALDCSKCGPLHAYSDSCKCADNVAAAERWFAVRAVDGEDVIAVMNAARDGTLQCRSSLVASQISRTLAAVSLDGTVDASTCGTSFSAPRVAWLAALRLAYVSESSLFKAEVDRGKQLRELVLGARVGGTARNDHFNLSIDKLFAE